MSQTVRPVTRRITLLLLTAAGFSVGSLVSGARYLEWVLPGGLPLGNVLAAAALCSLAGAAFHLSPLGSIRRRVSRVSLLAAAFWLPISIALAGNLTLNFSGYRGAAWLAITSVTARSEEHTSELQSLRHLVCRL